MVFSLNGQIMELPLPPPEALAFTDALKKRIADRIESENGWIPFSDYMNHALYEPELGYYSGGSVNLGQSGDFVTAPEISSLYGRALASAVAPLLEQTGARILEPGAGTGRLAQDMLDGLSDCGMSSVRYEILEISPDLRERQRQALAGYPQVDWLDTLPGCFEGVLIANEVLDAMPVQLVVKRKPGWYELGVGCENGGFVFRERPVSEALEAAIALQIQDGAVLPEGYVTEIHTHACAFVRTLAKMLTTGKAGAAVLVDYGFPGHEYYHPERNAGTLMCHYRHHAHADPFFMPGLQDITAHIDFSAIAKVAEKQGLDILCYTDQASFLIGAGLTDLVQDFSIQLDSIRMAPHMRTVQKLLSPAEMGELFKVMVLGHNMVPPAFMTEIDKSGRL